LSLINKDYREMREMAECIIQVLLRCGLETQMMIENVMSPWQHASRSIRTQS